MLERITQPKLVDDFLFNRIVTREDRLKYLKWFAACHPYYLWGQSDFLTTAPAILRMQDTVFLSNTINEDLFITNVGFGNTGEVINNNFTAQFRRLGSRQGFWLGNDIALTQGFLCRAQNSVFSSAANGQQRPFPLIPFEMKANDQLACDVQLVIDPGIPVGTFATVFARGYYVINDYEHFDEAKKRIARGREPETFVVRLSFTFAGGPNGDNRIIDTEPFKDPCYVLAIARTANIVHSKVRVYDVFRRTHWSDDLVPNYGLMTPSINGANARGLPVWDWLPMPYFVDYNNELKVQILNDAWDTSFDAGAASIYLLCRTV